MEALLVRNLAAPLALFQAFSRIRFQEPVTQQLVILLVEDQELILSILEESLLDEGFAVMSAASGESAIRALDLPGSNYSAILTDIDLGGTVSGWDVAR